MTRRSLSCSEIPYNLGPGSSAQPWSLSSKDHYRLCGFLANWIWCFQRCNVSLLWGYCVWSAQKFPTTWALIECSRGDMLFENICPCCGQQDESTVHITQYQESADCYVLQIYPEEDTVAPWHQERWGCHPWLPWWTFHQGLMKS